MSEVSVSIFNRNYRLAVSTGEEDLLRACAEEVDRRMKSVHAGGRVMGADQIAVLSALDIAYDAKKAQKPAEPAVAEAAPQPTGAPNGEDARNLKTVRELCRICEEAILQDTRLGGLF